MAVDTAHKHRADAVQHGKVRNAFICRGGKHNLVLLPMLKVGRYHPQPEYLFIKRLLDIVISAVS